MTALEIQRCISIRQNRTSRRSRSRLPKRTRSFASGVKRSTRSRKIATLVGRIDWVTKRYLIGNAGGGDPDSEKKIDLRYHEIGKGYARQLVQSAWRPFSSTQRRSNAAITTPPSETPARIRGRLIRELAASQDRVTVSWDSVRIGDGSEDQSSSSMISGIDDE